MPDRSSPDSSAFVGHPLRGRQWRVVGGVQHVPGTTPTLEFDDEGVSGIAGCNRFRSAVSLEGSRWVVQGPFIATLMLCSPELMALEQELLARLGRATGCRVTEPGTPTPGTPTSGDSEGALVELIGIGGDVVLVLEPIDAVHDLLGDWRVAMVHVPERQVVSSVDGTLTVTFGLDGPTARISGHGGVNRFHGPVDVGTGILRIGPLASTRMAGPPETMAQEAHLLRALEATVGWRLGRGGIDLVRADGGIAVSLVPAVSPPE